MKITTILRVTLGLLPLLAVLAAGSASADTDVAKTLQDKLKAREAKFESACGTDIRKYCKTVTPGEGRMIYCMQAHEDKISPPCAFEVEDLLTNEQDSIEDLKSAIGACKAELSGVCAKVVPGQGRLVGCLEQNKSAASKGCADALQKIEANSAQ